MFNKLIVLAFFFVATGCANTEVVGSPKSAGAGELVTRSLLHDGGRRFYHVRLPADFNPEVPQPLVVVLHGGGGKGSDFDELMTSGTLTVAADRRSVVLAFPQGKGRQWNDGRPEIVRNGREYDDVSFISRMIDAIVARHNLDSKRVYATGISNGGHMTLRLAMDLSTKLAAIAPVAALLPRAISDSKPERPLSVMFVAGTKDPLVPFKGGHIRLSSVGRSRGEVLSAQQSLRFFGRVNGCRASSALKRLPDTDPRDGTRVERQILRHCTGTAEVRLLRVIGGGHTWPGGNQYLRARRVGTVSRDINASELILNFFLKHTR